MYNNIHGWNVTKDTPFCHSSLPSTQSARHIKLECHLPQWSAPWLKFSLVCALFCAIVWLKHAQKKHSVPGCGLAPHGTKAHLRVAGKWVASHIREHSGTADQ